MRELTRRERGVRRVQYCNFRSAVTQQTDGMVEPGVRQHEGAVDWEGKREKRSGERGVGGWMRKC
jgi:hypothetical protein